MNSWTVLLLLDVTRGRCIAKRQATSQEQVSLWLLAHEAYPDASVRFLVVG